MPDFDELLRERLARPLSVVPPPIGELQRRAARRRQRRVSVVAAAVVACVAVVAAGSTLPWALGDRDGGMYASGLRDRVLDAGTDRHGAWRVVVTQDDGWCIKRVSASGEGGACGLTPPGRLGEASQFPTFDGDQYVVVLAGPAPPGTNRIEVFAQGVTAVATISEIEGRLFWSTRVPPGDGETRAVAYDISGQVIDELSWPPAPDASTLPTPPPPELVTRCPTAVNAETGEATCPSG